MRTRPRPLTAGEAPRCPSLLHLNVSISAKGDIIIYKLKSLILAVGIICSQIRDGGLVVCTVAMLLLSLSLRLRHGEK